MSTDNAMSTSSGTSGGASDPGIHIASDHGVGSARSGGGNGGAGDIRSMTAAITDQADAARKLLTAYADILAGDEQATADTIEGETDLHAAIAIAADRIAENDALVDAIKSRADALGVRRKRLEAQSDLLRSAIGVAMEVATIKRLQLSEATITLKATPVSAIVMDEAAIPARFWKPQEPKLDKRAVLDALKAKETVPGAALSNGGSTVQIRRG